MSGLCINWRQLLAHFSSLHGSHVDNINDRKHVYVVVRPLLMARYVVVRRLLMARYVVVMPL